MLADNRLAEQADWDLQMLALEAGELRDLGSIGFEAAEIDDLLANDSADPREDETPEVPAVPVSRVGDLWLLDRHRLLCGDSTSAEAVSQLFSGIAATAEARDVEP